MDVVGLDGEMIEADAPTRLVRGVQGLAIRVAKAVPGALGIRCRILLGRDIAPL